MRCRFLGILCVGVLSLLGLQLQCAIADTKVSAELRFFHEAFLANGQATIVGKKLNNPKLVAKFYVDNEHRPIWTDEKKQVNQLQILINEIEASQKHGFVLENYHYDVLSSGHHAETVIEILATDAFFSQVKHRTLGVISPHQIDTSRFLPAREVDAINVLKAAIDNNDMADRLHRLWPSQIEYWSLINKRKALLEQAGDQAITIPTGTVLKKGVVDGRVTTLKQRLLGPGDYSQEFDEVIEQAVKQFQISNGLEPDGAVGKLTIEVLNTSPSFLVDRIDANLERWRWLPNTIPSSYIRVNIAAFQLRVFKDAVEQLNMKVIVGKPYRKTPVFTESMKYMVVNPYWNVPFSLATQDKLPVLKTDPKSLETQGFEAKPNNSDKFLPVTSFDWSNVYPRSFSYSLRQKPGPKNALGTIKFMLPNQHSVYLHDTPDHSLFLKQERSFSSGCIRVSEPGLLAEWILQNDNQPQMIDNLSVALQNNQTQTIYLKTPLPVLIVYFTAFENNQQQIVFRRDIYNRDEPIIAALREKRKHAN